MVGTGLVGSTGALVLSRLKNVVIKAFERAPEPREAGAWISLSVSGLAILNRLVDPAQIRRIVYRPPDKAVYVARHWRTGQILARNYSSPGHAPDYIQARTHRFPLLQAILSNVPEGIIQYGYNVVDVVVTDDGVRLFFQDQPSQDFDLVVAADGIYSVSGCVLRPIRDTHGRAENSAEVPPSSPSRLQGRGGIPKDLPGQPGRRHSGPARRQLGVAGER